MGRDLVVVTGSTCPIGGKGDDEGSSEGGQGWAGGVKEGYLHRRLPELGQR